MRSTIAAIAAIFVMTNPALAKPLTNAEIQRRNEVIAAEYNYQVGLHKQLIATTETAPYVKWAFPYRLSLGYGWCKALRSGKSFKQLAQRVDSKFEQGEAIAIQMAGVVATQYLCPEQNEKVWYR